MGWVTRLELAISRATIWRFNQLSYTHHMSYLPCYMDYPRLRPTLSILHRFNLNPRYDFWSGWRGSNPRPSEWQSDALPTEPQPHLWYLRSQRRSSALVPHFPNLLPIFAGINGERTFLSILANGTNYGEWCALLDSNQWPPALLEPCYNLEIISFAL